MMRPSQLLIGAGLAGLGMSSLLCDNIGLIKRYLSNSTTITCGGQNQRWSDYAAPTPEAIFKVGDENDVALIVQGAVKTGTPFLLQSGGNGWANTFKLGSDGIIIDVSGLKQISFNSAKTEVTFQAGVTNAEVIEAAWNNNARVSASTCNCVSLLGATLGGGLSRTQGLYGLNADQLLSLNIVTADGRKQTVTSKSNPELWWAMRGAGANFAIVTSATYKSNPLPQANNTAWTGPVIFDQSKIESLIAAVDKLILEPEMQIDIYFTVSPLDGKPAVLTLPFYLGDEATGRAKFASVFNVGPAYANLSVIPYNTWNSAGDSFCLDGGRKPSYTAGLKKLDPATWRRVWNEYIAFYDAYPEANQTTVLSECYADTKTAKSVQDDGTSSYAHRDVKCYAIAIPWYTSPSLDAAAIRFGRTVRSLFTATAGTRSPEYYVNFAHGDEPLSQVYGNNLYRLQALKNKYDPKRRFNQWFPL
ncbi:FAD binding domain-containing protein [Xylariaceae sp. FL0594]|nr:FAD binding domain-containing protein [Xylariaceae sp. FL0594]